MSYSTYSASPSFDIQASTQPYWGDRKEFRIPVEEIPALGGTLVQLELLLLKSRRFDLEEVTRLVRSDVGLAIQVLRHAQSDAFGGEERWQLSDCIVHLGPRLMEVARPLCCWAENRQAAFAQAEAFWTHAKLVANVAERAASYFPELNVNPEKAYIAGLFHNLKRLPEILDSGDESNLKGASRTIQEWIVECNLPSFVTDVLETLETETVPGNMDALSRMVCFAKQWVDLCLPQSESCVPRRSQFNLQVLRAATLIYNCFPATEPDPFVPFMYILTDTTLELLDVERPESASVVRRTVTNIRPEAKCRRENISI